MAAVYDPQAGKAAGPAVGPHILLVDAEKKDRGLLAYAFEEAGLQLPHMVGTVAEALAYVRGDLCYSDRQKFPVPSLVITEIMFPGGDGFELIKKIRNGPKLNPMPIVVLTASESRQHVSRAFRLGVQSHFRKPDELLSLTRLVSIMHVYWSDSEVPPHAAVFRRLAPSHQVHNRRRSKKR